MKSKSRLILVIFFFSFISAKLFSSEIKKYTRLAISVDFSDEFEKEINKLKLSILKQFEKQDSFIPQKNIFYLLPTFRIQTKNADKFLFIWTECKKIFLEQMAKSGGHEVGKSTYVRSGDSKLRGILKSKKCIDEPQAQLIAEFAPNTKSLIAKFIQDFAKNLLINDIIDKKQFENLINYQPYISLGYITFAYLKSYLGRPNPKKKLARFLENLLKLCNSNIALKFFKPKDILLVGKYI